MLSGFSGTDKKTWEESGREKRSDVDSGRDRKSGVDWEAVKLQI